MKFGQVKFFHAKEDKLFGFIVPDDGSPEVFFHFNNGGSSNVMVDIEWYCWCDEIPPFRLPRAGDRLVYDLGNPKTGRGPSASCWAFESNLQSALEGEKIELGLGEARSLLFGVPHETHELDGNNGCEVAWGLKRAPIAKAYFVEGKWAIAIFETSIYQGKTIRGDDATALAECCADVGFGSMSEEELLRGIESLAPQPKSC